jgi:hypothetical protein
MHRECKLILHWQLIRMFQSFMSYQEIGVKLGDMAKKMILIG